MNEATKYIARILFSNKIQKADGNAFEDLFCSVMKYRYKNFQKIKPQGSLGDGKNDGYRSGEGIYYQVYAPEKPTQNDSKGAKKALEDFVGLLSYWNSIEEVKAYHFVLNDKDRGVYPEIHKKISQIKSEYKIETAIFSSGDLEELLFELDDSQIQIITGGIPNPEEIELDYGVLNEVISHLLSFPSDIPKTKDLNVPDFDTKIQFNKLSKIPATLLNNAGLKLYQLEEFFRNSNSKTIRKDLQIKFINFYEDSDEKFDSSDEIFFSILTEASKDVKCDGDKEQSIQDSVLVLMAYYFEHCDIFKEPQ